jgi:cytoskeletal protein CcmA (bactofilin family)
MKQSTSIFAQGLKVVGAVTGDGLVEIRGAVEGDLICTSVVVCESANVSGNITAQEVVVDGAFEGPIRGGNVTLKSHAHLFGDIEYRSITFEKGVFFEGRLTRGDGDDHLAALTVVPQVKKAVADRHRVKCSSRPCCVLPSLAC